MSLRRFALFLIGFTATSGQILLLREYISAFNGNELIIGIYLSIWLLATAVGSGPVARLTARRDRVLSPPGNRDSEPAGNRDSEPAGNRDSELAVRFAVVQFFSGICLLYAIVGLLTLPSPLRPSTGEVAGLGPALVSAAIFLFPFCVLQGLLFPLGTRLFRSESPDASISRVYFLESLGAGTGGLLFSLVFVHLMSSFQNIAVLSALNGFAACLLLKNHDRRRLSQMFYLVAGVIVILCVLDPITNKAATQRWKGLKVVALKQSHYGNLSVVSIDTQFSIYEDGLLIFTTEDIQSAEEAANVPLLEHPAPSRVLLLGGGVGGVIREMLKYNTVSRIDYVELDPELITLSQRVLPLKYVIDLDDARVAIHYTDGRRFLEETSDRYDVVAMQIPPPYTAQLNRFYTKEFFELVRSHLRAGGVFAFAAPPVAEYVGSELGAFLASISRTLSSVFITHVIIPANRTFFVSSPDRNPYVVTSPDSLLSRLYSRRIETVFFRDYFLTSTLSRERLDYLVKRLATSEAVSINTDLRPTSFYYDLVLWSAEYERFMKGILEWVFVNRWSLWAIIAAAIVALAGLARSGKKNRLVLSALAVSGFSAIVLELEVLLCFQLLYGSLYDRIGVLLTCYMLGLAIGTLLERRQNSSGSAGDKALLPPGRNALLRPAIIQIATAVFALCFITIVYLTVGAMSGGAAAREVSRGTTTVLEWSFTIFALVAGGLGGALFSSASRVFFATASSTSTGVTYAWDLVGSWFGAVSCSAVLFPVEGVVNTTIMVAILLIVSGLSLVRASG